MHRGQEIKVSSLICSYQKYYEEKKLSVANSKYITARTFSTQFPEKRSFKKSLKRMYEMNLFNFEWK